MVIAVTLVLGECGAPVRAALVSLGALAGLSAWTWLALLWSDDPAATVARRPAGAPLRRRPRRARAARVRRATVPLVLAATLVAIFLASGYGLLTRLFPERLGVYDSVAAHRLEEPLTYWNALGVFAGMGARLRLASRARADARRPSARGSDAAPLLRDHLLHVQPRSLGRGRGRARDRCRRRSAEAPAPARGARAGTGLRRSPSSSRRQDALTRTDAPLAAASTTVTVWPSTCSCWPPRRRSSRSVLRSPSGDRSSPPGAACFAGALAVVAVASLLAVFVRYGGPTTLAERATTRSRPPPGRPRRPQRASLHVLGELPEGALARGLGRLRGHPVLGSGPGTYEQYWNAAPPAPAQGSGRAQPLPRGPRRARPVGLLLLLLALGAPLVAAVLARGHPLVPARARRVCGLPRPCRRRLGLGDDRGHYRGARLRGALRRARPTGAMLRRSSRRGYARLRSSPFSSAVVAFVGVVGASALPRATGLSRRAGTTRPHPRHARPHAGGAGRPIRGGSSAMSQRSGDDTAAARELPEGALEERERLEPLVRPLTVSTARRRGARSPSPAAEPLCQLGFRGDRQSFALTRSRTRSR